MDLFGIMIAGLGLLAFASISGRLQGSVLTAPIAIVAFGFVIGPGGLNVAEFPVGHDALHLLAEITLVIILFTDASRIDFTRLAHDHTLPARMLLIGLPLTIIAGAGVAAVMFEEFSFWEAALLAAILAPTDAALGQAVVSDRSVPVRIRQALNVESGLNDGIALPAVLMIAAVASGAAGMEATRSFSDWTLFGLAQVTLGPLAGIAIGYAGGRLIDICAATGWMEDTYEGVAILVVALVAYAGAELIGGNGFISAFTAGLTLGAVIRHKCEFLFAFMENEGRLLVLVTFLVFGIAMAPEGLAHLDWRIVVYALLSLTVLRMAPIALSLVGAKLHRPTLLFLGWFGPRGLASILFVLLILEEAEIPHKEEIFATVIVTVLLSVILHGVTAAPLARAYGRLAAKKGDCPEKIPVSEMPLR